MGLGSWLDDEMQEVPIRPTGVPMGCRQRLMRSTMPQSRAAWRCSGASRQTTTARRPPSAATTASLAWYLPIPYNYLATPHARACLRVALTACHRLVRGAHLPRSIPLSTWAGRRQAHGAQDAAGAGGDSPRRRGGQRAVPAPCAGAHGWVHALMEHPACLVQHETHASHRNVERCSV